MKNPKRAGSRSRKKPARTHAYPFEFRLRVVRLHLEEGYSRALLAEQFGISTHSIQRWVKAYREGGDDALHPKPRTAIPLAGSLTGKSGLEPGEKRTHAESRSLWQSPAVYAFAPNSRSYKSQTGVQCSGRCGGNKRAIAPAQGGRQTSEGRHPGGRETAAAGLDCSCRRPFLFRVGACRRYRRTSPRFSWPLRSACPSPLSCAEKWPVGVRQVF
ncbi:MAG: helix-turn-helix domain-containing protein [Deltaproteobacteria bacterium]|nr:helix-turn-helix domain-containing protein [Deltaproteobacteria bacterium]